MLDHTGAERLLGELAFLERPDRLRQRVGHTLQIARTVGVADESLRRLDLVADAVEAGSERGGEGEVGVGIGTGDAALDAQALAIAHHPESGGAVVVAPREPRRRPRSVDVALIGVDR